MLKVFKIDMIKRFNLEHRKQRNFGVFRVLFMVLFKMFKIKQKVLIFILKKNYPILRVFFYKRNNI